MADQTLEAVIKLKDEISKPLQNVQRELNNVNKTSGQTSKALNQLQRLKPILLAIKDKTSPVIEKVKKILQKVTGKHWNTIVKAKDMATKVISKVKGVLQTVTSKAWSAMLKARDKISPIVSKVQGALKGVTSKVWKAMVTVKDKASSILNTIKTKLAVLAAGVTIGIKAVLDTTEVSKEYNRNQAVIAGAATQGEYNTKDLKAMRRTMYGYTGDDMMATNAVSNLTGMGLSVKEMQKTLESATAVWTKYGDSIPIEGLTESINETAQVSKVTGNLADALNWAGVSEDDFNKKLESTKTVQERAKLINDTLMQSYGKSKQIYDENTKAIRAYNESQDAVAEKQAQLGQTLAPVNTMINNVKVSLMNGLIPIIQQLTPQLLEFGENVKSAFETFGKSEEASNLLQIFQTVATTVWNAIKTVIDAVSPTIKNIFDWIGDHSVQIQGAIQTLGDIWKIVWDGIQVAIEAVWPVISQILDWLFDHMDEIKGIVQKVGNIWNDVWSVAGPLLQKAWTILKPILSSFIDALDTVLGIVEKVSGAISGLVNAFRNLASAWRNGDVQKALSNSNAGNGNNTYQSTLGQPRAMGQRTIPYDNFPIRAHKGEMLLPARDARQYKQGKSSSPQISIVMNGTVIRENADIEKIASALVRKINEQRIITNG